MKEIKIYTDGSCIGNPGPGGWAVLILDGAKKIILKGREPYTTNNRMEMMAIIEALKWMETVPSAKAASSINKAEIFSDSNLLIQSLTQNWKRKKNKDLWTQLDKHLKNKTIKWTWVEGHADNKYNNEVDKLAISESLLAQKLSHKNPALAKSDWESQQKLF
ncbi:ribonuclease HI [Candidatus Peregrinibacteria bacterium]|nr:ribonuclease HI [Candidatus Peregrinibacteria bacterium]